MIPAFFIGNDETKLGSRGDKSRAHAERLAKTIAERWAEVGHPEVDAWVETVSFRTLKENADHTFVVRSNLVNGLPPRSAIRKAA